MKQDTWTIKAELTVFAGDMGGEDVIEEAERQLALLTDGSDFISFSVLEAERDNI